MCVRVKIRLCLSVLCMCRSVCDGKRVSEYACLCVCVREREKERESMCVRVRVETKCVIVYILGL
jgi:hypothetical protein